MSLETRPITWWWECHGDDNLEDSKPRNFKSLRPWEVSVLQAASRTLQPVATRDATACSMPKGILQLFSGGGRHSLEKPVTTRTLLELATAG